MQRTNLKPLLEPRSIAVVGASTDPRKAGTVLLRNILTAGFPGKVYPVHPTADTIAGLACYRSIDLIPEPVDLAFLVLRRNRILESARRCAQAGVRSVVIVTAGFGEADKDGQQAQAQLTSIFAEHGTIAIGPNTIGTVSMGGRMLGTFVPFPRWDDGPVAIVAQTGIFAGAVLLEVMTAPSQRLGVNLSVDIGNRVGADELDFLEELDTRDDIEVLGFYLEQFADAPRFLARAVEVKRRKPVVVLKPGLTEQGARAAASHTGSLAVDDKVLDQLLRQHGITRAADVEEFLAFLKTFSYAPLPAGSRVGVITYSGAMGVIATDQLMEEGLSLATLSAETIERIRSIVPSWQKVENPADLWSAIEMDPRQSVSVGFSAMLNDPNVDQVLGIMLAVPNADFEDFRAAFDDLRRTAPDKPLHLVMAGGLRERWTEQLEGFGIAVHGSTRVAVRAMAAATRYAKVRDFIPSVYR